MWWRIEVRTKSRENDPVARAIQKDILDLGISTVRQVDFAHIYILQADDDIHKIKRISEILLVDPVFQDYEVTALDDTPSYVNSEDVHHIEITYLPGVMDPVEASFMKAVADLGIDTVRSVKTAKKYTIKGRLTAAQLNFICDKLLYNKLIQKIVGSPSCYHRELSAPLYQFKIHYVDLLQADDRQLLRLSKEGQLNLSLAEMRKIKSYFRRLGRNPTDCELETIAQTWSEHCWHKTFRGKIDYQERLVYPRPKMSRRRINNLLKSTIMKVTSQLNRPWCLSVFKDNAGAIEFDHNYAICFKVETHNHPSALEPFGGANTGIGGVIRDVLGTGLGARPIFNTDVFCFGPPDFPLRRLPQTLLHPKRIMKGVVSGVADYGNKMGIPTINGAIRFHDGFLANPLVYCGTAGIIPKDKLQKHPQSGDLIVVIGGRTGRDGIHGATFSSAELDNQSHVISSASVQIGNPIEEKKMLEALLRAGGNGLYNAVTDCGAGGLSSAVGEMAKDLGAEVFLEKVPLKYSGLSYTEIWISESQERMVLAVPAQHLEALKEICAEESVEMAVIGKFTDNKRLQLYYAGNKVADLEMEFLHRGIPLPCKKAVFSQRRYPEVLKKTQKKKLNNVLLSLLGHYDICSKEWVIRQYDHEVQAATILKPLVGIDNDGPADAAVVRPLFDSLRGVVVSNGINFRYGFIDPYWMAASCIDEALRQIIAVGGSLRQVALLDNFCWGNPDKPDRLGSLVRAAWGCYDIAKGFGVPFISGKDSLNNEYLLEGKSLAIPGTLLISALGIIEDTTKLVSMYAKHPDDLIYVVGMTYDELGGSCYLDLKGQIGNSVPQVDVSLAKKIFRQLSLASQEGLIAAMHDCADGGLAVALAEMAFSGNLGMDIFLSEVPYGVRYARKQKRQRQGNEFTLFSESNSRFVVEVSRKNQKKFEKLLRGIPFGLIGCLNNKPYFTVYGLDCKVCIQLDLRQLKEAWQKPLRW